MRVLNTSNWPEKKLDVLRELHLDPRNVRLELDPKVEADILEDLFINENALGLVDAICRVGYLTHDVPVAIKRGKKYVMVEGNRRLAALKAIQNPQLVSTHRARIAALADGLEDRSSLSKVRVMVAPSQTAADQLVAAIHTSNLRRRWGPTRQAAFFQAQVDSEKKLKTLVARYPTIDVRKFVFRAHIVNAFRTAKFKDPALRDFLTTKQWLSVLARIYESREFRDITGFKMDDEGKLSKSISQAKFDKIASTIVQGMRSGDLNTRSLNSVRSPRFALLMEELREIVEPKPSSGASGKGSKKAKGKGKQSAGKKGKGGTGSGANPGSGTGSRPGRKRHYLDLNQIILPESYPKATKLCVQELSAIDVQKFPNAAFLLMRAVLEKSIKAFAESKGADIKGVGNEQGRVQLGHALKWLLQYAQEEGPRSIVQPIQRVRDGKLIYMASSDSLNAVNHNHKFSVDPDEALAMWDALDPIMRYVIKV